MADILASFATQNTVWKYIILTPVAAPILLPPHHPQNYIEH